MPIGRTCFALICLVVAASPAIAGTHRVASIKEFKAAVAKLKPGDELVLADGEWRDVELQLMGAGTAEAPITLRPETLGGVTLVGASQLELSGSFLVVDGLRFAGCVLDEDVIAFRTHSQRLASDCRVTNCTIENVRPIAPEQSSKWISIYGQRNRFDHNLVSGKINGGTTLVVWLNGQPAEHKIAHNYFGPRPRLGKNGGETVRVGDSETSMENARCIVEDNLFEACNGEVEVVSNKSCENVYRRNTFLACEGTLALRHGNRCTVTGNFFLGQGQPGTGGVRIMGEDHRVANNYFERLTGDDTRAGLSLQNGVNGAPLNGHWQVKRAVVAFNTFVDCKQAICIGVRDEKKADASPLDCVLADNLVVSRGKQPIVKQHAAPINLQWQGNLVQGENLGIEPSGGLVLSENLLEPSADGRWRPGPKSPALGKATGDYAWVVNDIDGQPRGPQRDVGCDQASTAAIQSRPLKAEDVGQRRMHPPK